VMPKRLSVLPLVTGVFLLSGCGSGPKVTGTVTMNGSAVDGAVVTFYGESSDPKEPADAYSGKTDSSGHFKLNVGKGATVKAGTYKVTVVKPIPKPGATMPEGVNDPVQLMSLGLTVNALPPIYANAASTPLKAEVKSRDTDVPLTLEGGKPPGTP
jgi:hypothetical protein